MANTTDYTRLLDGYSLLAIKDFVATNYAAKSHTHTKSQITDFPTSMPASDVYAWAKAATKPSYTYSEVGAASSDIYPNNSGEIKSKYRIALKGYTGSGNPIWYYKLVRLPVDNSGNYASAIINGRIGGWVSSDMSSIYCLIWNRNGIGLALLDIGGTGTMSTIFGTADLVVYKNSDNTADIYIKCKGYFTFDLDIEVYQSSASITYDGTYITTTPSGTESGKASTSTSRIQLEQGVLKVNGTAVSLSTHNHDATYLGISAKAADADKLDGHDSSYFINTSNIGSQSVYYADNAGYSSESHTLNGQEASYYLNYNNLTNKPSAVLYTSQTLTDAQKTQARTNIGAGTSSFTGYTSSNKLSTNYIKNDAGWTSNAGTVIGSGLTANYFVVGNGTVNVKISSLKPTTSSTTWGETNDVNVPTMKAISSYVLGKGYSTFTGYTSSNKLHTDYINNAAGWTSVTESTVSGWGFTKNAGTITSVKVGSTSYSPSSGVVSLPAYPTKASWNYDDVYIKLTGNQSISGIKTFTGKIGISDGQNSYTFIPGQAGDVVVELVDEQDNKTTVYLMNPNTPNTVQYIALRSWVSDNYAAKSHTHTLSIASGGSSPTTLAANTTYTLTAGGSTLVFKTPPSSSAYYSNQFNQAYFFSTNAAIALNTLSDTGNMAIGFSNYSTTHDYYLQSGHSIYTYSKYFIMNLAQTSDYVGSIIFGRTDNGYDNIIVSRGDYGPSTGYTQENLDILRMYASSMYINVKSSDSVLYNIPLGRKCHTVTITGGTGTSTILFNLRNTTYGQITSIAGACAALYYNGHRNAASALIANGIYGSYTKPIIGIYATSSNSGLNVVYMNGTTKYTTGITSGTIADNTSVALYEP